MDKLAFSGHESFHCRALWLKKGYDFQSDNGDYRDPAAVVKLGVGKNMVSSIQYWTRAFRLVNRDNSFSELANFLFGAEGVDPYLENVASLWLLHYHLVNENVASIYSLVFNDFRKKRIEFSKNHLLHFIKRTCDETGTDFNDKTVQRDISVFLRNYVRPERTTKNIEELFSGMFIELGLVERLKRVGDPGDEWYKIENRDRVDLPVEVVLYAILSNQANAGSIQFDDLLVGINSVGSVFAMSSKGLLDKISQITKTYRSITFTDYAGVRVLQFDRLLDKWKVLRKYYEK